MPIEEDDTVHEEVVKEKDSNVPLETTYIVEDDEPYWAATP